MSGTTPRGIDAHCHVDLYPDPEATLREAESAGIAIIAVTNTPSVFPHMVRFAAGHGGIYPALGLHPELAAERANELDLFRDLAKQTPFIGEVGLDGTSQDPTMRTRQRHVFSEVLRTCRAMGDKVLTIHSRRAEAAVLEMIGVGFPGIVILHWFSGSQATAREALKQGAYFSMNPAMLRSRSGRSLLAMLPQDRVLTETDGPFSKIGERQVFPEDVFSCLPALAESWRVAPEEAARIVVENFQACLRRAPSKG